MAAYICETAWYARPPGRAALDGGIDERSYALYDELAAGGIGAIIIGFTGVAANDRYFDGMMRLCDNALVPQYARLVETIHAHGTPVLAQLALGAYYRDTPSGSVQTEPDDMTIAEIEEVEHWFVDAAVRAHKAGFDGVQLHLAHFFFLSRFVSPAVNHRLDAYGGSTGNRARIALEIMAGVRAAAPDLHISAKVNCSDFVPGGLTPQNALKLCRLLADAGIDSIEVSGNGTSVAGVRAGRDEAYFVPFAAELAEAVAMAREIEGIEGLKVPTDRGPLLDGVLFNGTAAPADTVLIAITGIHGNFYSNPFYVNFGQTLNAGDFDFVYAQTCDAFGQIQTEDWRCGKTVVIGSQTEDFDDAVDDVGSHVRWAEQAGYRHIYLAGHSLGANKVIRYLSVTHDPRVERFMLLSPANLTYLTSGTTTRERQLVDEYLATGRAEQMLPFALMGWAPCVAHTAHQWLDEPTLNNAHTEPDGDFSQAEQICHRGLLIVGTYDNFTRGDPVAFLRNLNTHMPTAEQNELVFVPRTGHTYQQKEQEVADKLCEVIAPDHVYMRFADIPVWSVANMLVDRRMYLGGTRGPGNHNALHRPHDGALMGMQARAA